MGRSGAPIWTAESGHTAAPVPAIAGKISRRCTVVTPGGFPPVAFCRLMRARQTRSHQVPADVEPPEVRSQSPSDVARGRDIGRLLRRDLRLFPDYGRPRGACAPRRYRRHCGEDAGAATGQDPVGRQPALGLSQPRPRFGLCDDARPVPGVPRHERRHPPALLQRRAGPGEPAAASFRGLLSRPVRPRPRSGTACDRARSEARRGRGLGRAGRTDGGGLARGRPLDAGAGDRAAAALRAGLRRAGTRAAPHPHDPHRPRADCRQRPHHAAAAVRPCRALRDRRRIQPSCRKPRQCACRTQRADAEADRAPGRGAPPPRARAA
ncbi:hypothetical protein ACVWW7_008128 [Bradyrhizobium sp. LM6.9]